MAASSVLTSESRTNYGFGDRLTENFPSQVMVDATEICNLACVHCPHPIFKKSEHYAGRHLDPDLNHKMVEEVRTSGKGCTNFIRYTSNGEPLVHPKIYDMLEDAVLNSGTFVTLTTNGTILNEQRVEKLLSSGLHLIDISIDAIKDETYSKIRVHGKLETTRANVVRLLKIRSEVKADTKIIISFVEQSQNTGEAEDFKKFWHDQGADKVIIRRLHSSAGGVKNIAQDLIDRVATLKRRPCLYPWERIVLTPSGELTFCPQDWVHGSVVTDYHKTTIKETWQSDFYKKLREAHLTNNFCNHKFCGQCPDWATTRWPGEEGNSYADMVEDFKEN
jgi:MoaA/NifB/PqqE/SkfB family radical SAM enzyme